MRNHHFRFAARQKNYTTQTKQQKFCATNCMPPNNYLESSRLSRWRPWLFSPTRNIDFLGFYAKKTFQELVWTLSCFYSALKALCLRSLIREYFVFRNINLAFFLLILCIFEKKNFSKNSFELRHVYLFGSKIFMFSS